MTAHPNESTTDHPQPGSDEADPEKETTPAGVAGDLEEKAEELGATVGPSTPPAKDPDSPGATIDSPHPAEPNEPG